MGIRHLILRLTLRLFQLKGIVVFDKIPLYLTAYMCFQISLQFSLSILYDDKPRKKLNHYLIGLHQ